MIDVDPQFLSFLQSEESRAYNGTLLQEVEAAINSYNGQAYGDEEDGRSQVVAADVSETVDYMLTSILDVMISSGRVVEFEPQSEVDEELADDATEAMHYLYRRKSGYRVIHDWAKAGLVEKIGIVKSCVERKKKRVDALYHPSEFPESAIQAQETDQPHPVDGSPMIRAVTIEDTAAEFIDYLVPLEEFRIAPDARDFDTAVYLSHLTERSLSDLVEMGFDTSDVDLAEGSNPLFTALAQARDDGRPSWYGVLNRTGANRKVWLSEEYVLYDLDGDGIAERLCVHRVGNMVLSVEQVDYQPFEYWCPYPMQGRLIGQSLADKTMDIQRVNTVLERNMLDSLYFQTAPGTYVSDSAINDHTLDDLLTVRPGRIVRYTGNQAPIPEERNDTSQVAMAAIEFKIRQREARTGITRLNKGVDEDALNDTAAGQAMLMSRGQQMERYIIRNFAEAVARLFGRKVNLMRQYAEPFQIRVDGQYRTVDPSQWPEDMGVEVVVGLGSGSKQERIVYRQQVGQVQSMLKMAGSPIVTDDNIYNNAVGLARDCGLQPNDLFTEPPKDAQGNPIPPQPAPDPKAQALMAQVQVKQAALEQQAQMDQQKIQLMAQQHVDSAQLEEAKMNAQSALALRQQNLQAWIDKQQMELEASKHAATLDTQQKIAKMRPGGALNK
jgi:hypothetical protein